MLYDKKWDTVKITPALEPWQQTLLEAAQYIRNHGWTVGCYMFIPSGSVCMVGALHEVENSDAEGKAYHKLAKHLGMVPETWNDYKAGSKEEVIAKLEEVALKGE